MLFQRKRYHRIRPPPSATQYPTYGPQTPSQYGTGTRPYPVQRHIPPPMAPRSLSPTEATTSAQTVPQVYEPISLPEATLHHGEAPPDYEEAIKMKPPDTLDQD